MPKLVRGEPVAQRTKVSKAHTCQRPTCGHTWTQMARLKGRLPKTCPRCKSYEWQTPIQEVVS